MSAESEISLLSYTVITFIYGYLLLYIGYTVQRAISYYHATHFSLMSIIGVSLRDSIFLEGAARDQRGFSNEIEKFHLIILLLLFFVPYFIIPFWSLPIVEVSKIRDDILSQQLVPFVLISFTFLLLLTISLHLWSLKKVSYTYLSNKLVYVPFTVTANLLGYFYVLFLVNETTSLSFTTPNIDIFTFAMLLLSTYFIITALVKLNSLYEEISLVFKDQKKSIVDRISSLSIKSMSVLYSAILSFHLMGYLNSSFKFNTAVYNTTFLLLYFSIIFMTLILSSGFNKTNWKTSLSNTHQFSYPFMFLIILVIHLGRWLNV